ncbi:MAG: hypothetical protein GDA44_09695 [Prochloron sp. SP5CPC1]|nr:hypothetical protein [Candidatus Paraprochloron terpiosi SP5CPC1]
MTIKLATVENQPNVKPWWNRLLWGDRSLFADLRKPDVPEKAILLHNQVLKEARELTEQAELLEKKEFSNHEFLLFLRIKDNLEDLHQSAELLLAGLKVNQLFQVSEQLKLYYIGLKSEEFNSFLVDLLNENFTKDVMLALISNKLTSAIPQIGYAERNYALTHYLEALDKLAEQESVLQLISSWKQQELTKYSILKHINDIVQSIPTEYRQDLKALTVLVKANYKLFEQIASIIKIPAGKNTPKTHARILQYIALAHEYQADYSQFQELSKILAIWENSYQKILDIREEYNSHQYKQPQEFSQEIPGLELYQKYSTYLPNR